MKKLISGVLLIVAWPLFAGSGFEISGMMVTPSLPWAIALGLAAQATAYAAGLIASPKPGTVSLIRSIALVFFITQSVALPVFLFALIYGHFTRTDLVDSKHLVWALIQGFSALTLILKSAKAWNRGPSLSCSSGGGRRSRLECLSIPARPMFTLVFSHPNFDQPMAFHGRYIEVTPNSRIVWTNEEGADGPISTVTFEEKDGKTLLTLLELYPSKKALDDAIESGSTGTSAASEQFEELDELLVTLVKQ